MSATFDNFEALKRAVNELERENAETAGALKQVLETIKEKTGCTTIKEAKKFLTQFLEESQKETALYFKYKKEFFKDNPQLLERFPWLNQTGIAS